MAFSIAYEYIINDKMSAAFSKMAGAAKKFDKGVSRVQQGLGKTQSKLRATGESMANMQTGLAGLGAGAAIGSAIRETNRFGESLASIGTLIPGQTERLDSLQGTIREVAQNTGKDLNDIAGGAFQVISAFGDMQGETEGRLRAVSKAAVAGGASTTDSLNLLSAVTKGYGDTSAEALSKVSDLAFMTNKLGQTTFPELAANMGKVVPTASQLNVSQEELFASFASLTGVTGNTAEVSTQLSGILSSILKPTDAMTKAAKDLGFASASAMVKSEGLGSTLQLLMEHTGGSEEKVAGLFGRVEALRGVFALGGSQSDKFSMALSEMQKAAASGGQVTGAAFDEITKGINESGFQMKQFAVTMQELKVTVGETAATALGPFIERLSSLITGLKENNPGLLKFATYVLMGLAALSAILIPLGLLISSMGTVIGVVKTVIGLTKVWTAVTTVFNAVLSANPIALIILGVMALIAAIVLMVKHWDKVKAALMAAWNKMNEMAAAMGELFAGIGDAIASGVKAGIDKVIGLGRSVVQFFTGIKDKIAGMFGGIGEKVGAIAEKIGGFFGGGGEAAATPGRSPEAPVPAGAGGMVNASAEVSVYTERGMKAKPFERRGNLGYNMVGSSVR